MPNPRLVLAQGLIDGSNRVFYTGTPYVPGSTAYILNGRIHSRSLPRGPENDYGYEETAPDAGVITVDVAPLTDDVVQIYFMDRLVTPAPPVQNVSAQTITGRSLRGVVQQQPDAAQRITGIVRPK